VIRDDILRRPEKIKEQLEFARKSGFNEMVEAIEILLPSKASNDYLEKLAVESIGGTCSGNKLGADGFLCGGGGIEAKPHKGKSSQAKSSCINDDTPMKLKRDFDDIQTIVFMCASETGDKIHWQVVAPFRSWTKDRFLRICKRLKLNWEWPEDVGSQMECLNSLVAEHKKETYVRSNPLKLNVLLDIPVNEISLWVHPDLKAKDLPKIIRSLQSRMSVPQMAL
jgi:hypothetical protein